MRLCRNRKDQYAALGKCPILRLGWRTLYFEYEAALRCPHLGVDNVARRGIMWLTLPRRLNLNPASRPESKAAVLRRHHALNVRPENVSDPAFTSGNPFFDSDDLVQVKYEMLRRVRAEGESVTRAATSFGFSRPSYYETHAAFQTAGLPGLVPQRPGPRRAHKLSDEVLDFLTSTLAEDNFLNSARLAQLVGERFGITVHPRSVERALGRRKKGGLSAK